MKKALIIIFLLSLSISCSAMGQLFFFGNARPIAMGGAFTAVADGVDAVAYNPAVIAAMKGQAADVSGEFLYYTGNSPYEEQYMRKGISLDYARKYISVQIHHENDFMRNFMPTWDLFGNPGPPWYEMKWLYEKTIVAIRTGVNIGEYLLIGVSFNYNHLYRKVTTTYMNSVYTSGVYGLSGNVGIIGKINEFLCIGVVAENLASYQEKPYILEDLYNGILFGNRIPFFLNAGMSMKIEKLLIVLDCKNILENGLYLQDGEIDFKILRTINLGLEYKMPDNLSIRFGSSFKSTGEPVNKIIPVITGGVGYAIDRYNIDIAVVKAVDRVFDRDLPFEFYMTNGFKF